MFDASHLQLFVTIVNEGSLVKAARRLNLPTTRVSRDLAALEESLGARLLNRTTRSLSLTDAGHVYLDRVAPIVEAIEQANRAVTRVSHEVEGRLRITAPQLLGEHYVFDWVLRFQQIYPRVHIDLQLDNRYLNLPATGIDLALRAGQLEDSSLIARLVSTEQRKLVTTPAYLAAVSLPQTPQDVLSLLAITTGVESNTVSWTLQKQGEEVRIQPQGRLHLNDLGLALRALRAQGGVALLPEFLLRPLLQSGELVELLPDWKAPSIPVHLVYHSRRLLTLAQQAFIDFVCGEKKTVA